MHESKADDSLDEKYGLLHFWHTQNINDPLLLDRYSVNNVSIFVAYASYKLGFTPNQLSVASGVFSGFAFLSALILPPDSLTLSILAIFVLSQSSYLLDCADGQLARATNTESEFGAYLDVGIDVTSAMLSFGSLFCYLFRYHYDSGNYFLGDVSVLVGFLFILTRTSRFFLMQNFINIFKQREIDLRKQRSFAEGLGGSFMDQQMSLFGMLLFLVSASSGFALYIAQSIILGAVAVRYFLRARQIAES